MLAHVTDLNDAAAEESAPFCRAKKPTKGSERPWNPAILSVFRSVEQKTFIKTLHLKSSCKADVVSELFDIFEVERVGLCHLFHA